MITLALAGKPNCGKSTFFKAATMAQVEIANYPFTTIDANNGVAYVRTRCPCQDLGINGCGNCTGGVRFVPVALIDVAGLVPDAHKGRGLGNQFLDNLRQADAIIHVVDASGATDAEGNPVDPGSHDPREDIRFLEHEMTMWVVGILGKHWPRLQRQAQQRTFDIIDGVADVLAGLGITYEDVKDTADELGIDLRRTGEEDLEPFCERLLQRTKPVLFIGNKMDTATPEMLSGLKDLGAVPVSAAAELAVRMAADGGFIEYVPGDPSFAIKPETNLSAQQRAGLEKIAVLMAEHGGTGVQGVIDRAVYELLDQIVVYPVEDEHHYTDKQGRVLPDAFLMRRGSTPRDLAFRVHSDIGEGFLYAVDARSGMRIKESTELKDGDIIKIVSTKK
ncbi:redox-regulated ATPase YchF [Methanofollis fontis]|uniref:Redox-regulated ATPase YchF n=1 Tax=Methanofollis fontis TaxID=2052832 RepID=A0A483CMW7_9EURY|nr:redox-regulated ATPase YchF [Methanofollis fontis]TAJ44237.1 redox-regulated ATPase YchF [Methanofollis fontis]